MFNNTRLLTTLLHLPNANREVSHPLSLFEGRNHSYFLCNNILSSNNIHLNQIISPVTDQHISCSASHKVFKNSFNSAYLTGINKKGLFTLRVIHFNSVLLISAVIIFIYLHTEISCYWVLHTHASMEYSETSFCILQQINIWWFNRFCCFSGVINVDVIYSFICSAGSMVTSLDMLLRLFSYLTGLMEVICWETAMLAWAALPCLWG